MNLEKGSSPLARGTRQTLCQTAPVEGLIPARAGNTTGRSPPEAELGAHPRSRGEHCGAVNSTEMSPGSSPLARGTLRSRRGLSRLIGLIPARAGNTLGELVLSGAIGAHPRSRGEHSTMDANLWNLPGSSPLARGTPAPGTSAPPPIWAHPRSRGEHAPKVRRWSRQMGSSPLARGTRSSTCVLVW